MATSLLRPPRFRFWPSYAAGVHAGLPASRLLGIPRTLSFALWPGHESPTTTHQYTEANLAMKEKALARMQNPNTASRRFRASDSLLEFLKGL